MKTSLKLISAFLLMLTATLSYAQLPRNYHHTLIYSCNPYECTLCHAEADLKFTFNPTKTFYIEPVFLDRISLGQVVTVNNRAYVVIGMHVINSKWKDLKLRSVR